jgi:hypothetical protein
MCVPYVQVKAEWIVPAEPRTLAAVQVRKIPTQSIRLYTPTCGVLYSRGPCSCAYLQAFVNAFSNIDELPDLSFDSDLDLMLKKPAAADTVRTPQV